MRIPRRRRAVVAMWRAPMVMPIPLSDAAVAEAEEQLAALTELLQPADRAMIRGFLMRISFLAKNRPDPETLEEEISAAIDYLSVLPVMCFKAELAAVVLRDAGGWWMRGADLMDSLAPYARPLRERRDEMAGVLHAVRNPPALPAAIHVPNCLDETRSRRPRAPAPPPPSRPETPI
ncbi:hypothetical protein [Roseomonas sp. KE0001]|uniref:hypothetical protein n=1 Tax=Roseomonas sp. KE0001 TaxID=2479201 RepID=UPI0018DF8FA6|nr:hypothetical protein [Roseomonas sp. KE0001]